MADSPLKTKARKKKKRERIAEAVRWVSAIFEDGWFGSEEWMVLQGHRVENKILALELENCDMVEESENCCGYVGIWCKCTWFLWKLSTVSFF